MEELVIDNNYRIVGKSFGAMPFDDFLGCIEDISNNNSIMPISKNRYFVKIDNKDYYLLTDYLDVIRFAPESKYKEYMKRLNEACKLSKATNEVKETFGLSTIDIPRYNALMRNNKYRRNECSKKIVCSSLRSLLRILEGIYSIAWLPAPIIGGIIGKLFGVSFPIIAIAVILFSLSSILLLVYPLVKIISVGEWSWSNLIKPFKELSSECKKQISNKREYKLLKQLNNGKALQNKLNASTIESKTIDEDSQIKIDDRIEQIMQRVKELDENDQRTILGELKPIVEKYALEISKLKPGIGYKKDSLDIAKRFVGDVLSIDNKISLLIRRKNLEKVLKDCSSHEEIVIEKEEGPVRRLTPQN